MKVKTLAFAMCTLALAGCSVEDSPKQNPEFLKGKEFITTVRNVDISLTFDAKGERVSGKVLNRYNAAYSARENKIKIGPIVSTMMAGDPNAMKVEDEFFKFLERVETYKYRNHMLTLTDNYGSGMGFQQVVTVEE